MLSKSASNELYKIPNLARDFGKGCWMTIHILAYHATSLDEQKNFCRNIRIICGALPCKECRKHSVEYLQNNPPEKSIDSNDKKAMFKWSSDLHNNANRIKKVPLLDWKIMYERYEENCKDETAVCKGDCITGVSLVTSVQPTKVLPTPTVSHVQPKPEIKPSNSNTSIGRPIGMAPIGIYKKLRDKQKYGTRH